MSYFYVVVRDRFREELTFIWTVKMLKFYVIMHKSTGQRKIVVFASYYGVNGKFATIFRPLTCAMNCDTLSLPKKENTEAKHKRLDTTESAASFHVRAFLVWVV